MAWPPNNFLHSTPAHLDSSCGIRGAVNTRTSLTALGFILALNACSGQSGAVAMDPQNLGAADSGSHRPGSVQDAAASNDASSAAPMDGGAPTSDESQGHDAASPDTGPSEAGAVEAGDGDDAPS